MPSFPLQGSAPTPLAHHPNAGEPRLDTRLHATFPNAEEWRHVT